MMMVGKARKAVWCVVVVIPVIFEVDSGCIMVDCDFFGGVDVRW